MVNELMGWDFNFGLMGYGKFFLKLSSPEESIENANLTVVR